jgi:hypothetical protein
VHARGGVRLTRIKARLFDMLKTAGDGGLTFEQMRYRLTEDGEKTISDNTLKSHLTQIRGAFYDANADWVILCDRRRPTSYSLIKRPNRKETAE